jgi:hypothetical protein
MRDHGRNRWPAGKRSGGWRHGPKVLLCCNQTIQNNVNTIVETVEQIKQNSAGFSQGLELLTNFDNSDNSRMVYIYIREIKK